MKKYISQCAVFAIAVAAINNIAYCQQRKTHILVSAVPMSGTNEIIPNDPSVRIGKLANGLTYYIRRNIEPRKRAVLYLANRVGSLMEDDAQQGLAHFTEHMAFNGTADFPKDELINYLQKSGIRFGADLNAYTGFNQTVYQLPMPTDSAALFAIGFKILANWAGKQSMDAREIDAERGVIIEEDRQRGKNASDRMSKQLMPLLLNNSRYAERIPIGKIDILKNFTYDKIRSFYHDWYRPNLQAVIAVGDFDVDQVEWLIRANFSFLKNPANAKPRLEYNLPVNKTPLVKIVTDPEQAYNLAMVIYKHPHHANKTTEDYKKSLMYDMINDMLEARLQDILSKPDAPFIIAKSNFGPYQEGLVTNTYAFQTIVASNSASTMLSALSASLAENNRMAKFGFLQSELDVVKKNIASQNEQYFKEKNKIPSVEFVNRYLNNFLTGESIPSVEFDYEQIKRDLASITLRQVNALAKTLITKDNQIIIVRAPEKQKSDLPTEGQLLTAVESAFPEIKPYVDNTVANAPLIEKKPIPGRVIAERKLAAIGVIELTLSNGIKVLLKPTDFKNDQIVFQSFSKGGISLAGDANYQSAKNVSLISQSGIGKFSAIQLQKKLAGNTANARPYISDLYQGFSGSAAPKDIETAFQLIYAAVTEPRKDTDLFNKTIIDSKVVLAGRASDPNNVFKDTAEAVLNNYHPRRMPQTLQDLDKISLDEAFIFYKSRFADNGEQIFVIVGTMNMEKIKPLIETYIASLPTQNKKQNFVDEGIRPPRGRVLKTVYQGIEDKAQVQLYIHGDYDASLENDDQLYALTTALRIKIIERLREKEGGVYSPKVSLSLEKNPVAHYYVTISFSCAKDNVGRLVDAALEEVKIIRTNGVTPEDLVKFKSEEERQRELQLRDNNFWLSIITNRLKYRVELDTPPDLKARLDRVTVQSTQEAARKFLAEDNYIQLELMPKL